MPLCSGTDHRNSTTMDKQLLSKSKVKKTKMSRWIDVYPGISLLVLLFAIGCLIVNCMLIAELKQKAAVLRKEIKQLDQMLNNWSCEPGNKEKGGQDKPIPQSNQVTAVHLVLGANMSVPSLTSQNRLTWDIADKSIHSHHVFSLEDLGSGLAVKHSGLYLIYSQITYFDRSGRWSHAVMVDSLPVFKCIESKWGLEIDPVTNEYYNTVVQCYTAGVQYIRRGQEISIRSLCPDRHIHQDKDTTFFGVLKLA